MTPDFGGWGMSRNSARWLGRAGVMLACSSLLAGAQANSAPPPLKIYGSLPGFEMAALSPSGNRIALVGTLFEKRHLFFLDADAKPIQDLLVGEHKLRRLNWAGEDQILLWTTRTTKLGVGFLQDKAELAQVAVVPVAKGDLWWVFANKGTIAGNVQGDYGLVERDGRWFAFFGGVTLEKNSYGQTILTTTAQDLYKVDLQTQSAHRIALREEDFGRDWLIDGTGEIAATLDFRSGGGLWEIKTGNGKEILTGHNGLGGIGLVGFGRSPETLLFIQEDEASGDSSLFELPLGGGTPTEILADQQVSRLFSDPRNRQLLGYEVDADVPIAHFFDARREKVMAGTRKAFPGKLVSIISWNDAFDRLIVETEGTADPGTWWLVDIKTGKATDLGVSYPIDRAEVGAVSMIPYKAADGLEMNGVLTLPPGREAKNLPVILLPHGGPTARDYPGFDWWAQAFASRGYAVFQPNFRGSSGFGPTFERAGDGEWGRKMQTDISDGLAELARQGIVDPKRACIVGASYGGYAALAGVTVQQKLYRCAVSLAGIGDLPKMVATEKFESDNDRTLMRALKRLTGSGRNLKDISPIVFADRADAPILLIHGKDDTVVDYDQSSDMAAALRRANKPVQFITLEGEDHWLSKSETRLQMLEATVAFVQKNNPPD